MIWQNAGGRALVGPAAGTPSSGGLGCCLIIRGKRLLKPSLRSPIANSMSTRRCIGMEHWPSL